MKNPFRSLTKFEWGLWLSSVTLILVSFLLFSKDVLTLIASLIGVTALIFTAKGRVLGPFLIVVFSVFYGIISLYFRYYGEMITYLGMSTPMAILSIISWLKHPFRETAEVEVDRMNGKKWLGILTVSIAVAVGFYFILKALGNAQLLLSTLSVATSMVAACLTFFRSPYHALGYAVNDVVLIVLWILAAWTDISSLSMVICFVVFLIADLYGFYSWRRMQRRQEQAE